MPGIPYIKLIGLFAGIVSIIGGYFALANYHDNKGFNRAVVEIQVKANIEIEKATQKAIKEAEDKINKALKVQQDLHDAALVKAKAEREIKYITETIIDEIHDIEYVEGECNDFTLTDIELLNDSIRAVNNGSGSKSSGN